MDGPEDVCETVMPQAADEEDNRTSHDANALLDRVMFDELTFPSSRLNIQGSTNSDEGSQGASSSELLTSRAASSAETSLPNNPYDYELERLCREEERLKKNFEERTLELMAELERKMSEARNEYEKKLKEVDDEYKTRLMEEEAKKSMVEKSNLLASAYMYKTSDTSDVAALRAKVSSTQQQQQPLQTDSHVYSTSPPPSSPLSHCTITQTTVASQQGGEVQADTHMDLDTTALPPPSVPNLSASLRRGNRTRQPLTSSQQGGGVQTNAHVDPTSPPGLSLTSAEASVPNLSASLSHFPRGNRTQRRQISQQAPPPPSVTAAEASILSPPGPLSRPRQISQEPALVETDTQMTPAVEASKTPQARPHPPVISNLTPSSLAASSPFVRAPAPHIQPFRASPALTKTYQRQRTLVQEVQQEHGLVYLSEDDE
ncbi:unnamed protein product [Microthlaspi erraticum]|uniref:Uncharacterized protein n=1 Tax=Microthlaspi erraticum TaxID=1685480 RepID=A0A6D2HNP6_9BRAS|nr:unnamed protein product [Microthlaspi erraticum]